MNYADNGTSIEAAFYKHCVFEIVDAIVWPQFPPTHNYSSIIEKSHPRLVYFVRISYVEGRKLEGWLLFGFYKTAWSGDPLTFDEFYIKIYPTIPAAASKIKATTPTIILYLRFYFQVVSSLPSAIIL